MATGKLSWQRTRKLSLYREQMKRMGCRYSEQVHSMCVKQHDADREPGTRRTVAPLAVIWDAEGRTACGGGGGGGGLVGLCLGHIVLEMPEE